MEAGYPVPADEAARLDALRSYNVLDTPPEPEFDELVRLAAKLCNCPVAAITLIDEKRQWYKARFGLEASWTPRAADGLCSNAILNHEPMQVGDIELDPRFCDSDTFRQLGLRFYAGVPLVNRENLVLGTLCVLDHRPRLLPPEEIDGLKVIARQVLAQLELRRLAAVGEFRERLVSILSHDLWAPLQHVLMAARQGMGLGPGGLDPRYLSQIAISAERLTRMVRDVLDFTQTRLGNGLPVQTRPAHLHQICRRIVQEFSLSYPNREIQLELSGEGTGIWDEDRLGQAVTNLLANALRYGAPDRPIRLTSQTEGQFATVTVFNEGDPIPEQMRARLFAPFPRAAEAGRELASGLGLGLFIVKEIATSFGGTVEVSSTSDRGTTFRLRVPRGLPLETEIVKPMLRH
ncbi:MAG: GAF domain-containing sensor histidine kinase [Myxococcaceae bacterium]|nr:GAF domain-containing sensor histidine kinase [Myxococcaceae bacterium]